MASRLPPDPHSRYIRSTRRGTDRWGFVLVAAAVLGLIHLIGDTNPLAVDLRWITDVPSYLGFTMFSGQPERRTPGFAAPQFQPKHADTAEPPAE